MILDLDIYLWFVRLYSEPHTQKLIINRFILVIISDVPWFIGLHCFDCTMGKMVFITYLHPWEHEAHSQKGCLKDKRIYSLIIYVRIAKLSDGDKIDEIEDIKLW